jgi:hypothetical protein
MFHGNDLTETNLNNMYDVFSKEHISCLNSIKTDKETDDKKEKELHKKMSLLNTIMMSILRFRNLLKNEQAM